MDPVKEKLEKLNIKDEAEIEKVKKLIESLKASKGADGKTKGDAGEDKTAEAGDD